VGIDVETEITIERPRREVAAYVADPDNATEWYANIESVEWKSPKPLAVGSRLEFVAHFLGRTISYTYEVKENDDAERFVMATTDGPMQMETTYSWSDAPAQKTRMRLRNRGEPSGFSTLFTPIMSRAVRRANEKDLRRLKEILERGPESQME